MNLGGGITLIAPVDRYDLRNEAQFRRQLEVYLRQNAPNGTNLSPTTAALNAATFGASPSASAADNSSAFAAALAASDGAAVYVNPGTYQYDTGLALGDSGQWLIGSGRAATILEFTGNSGVAVTITGAGQRGAGVEHLRVNCSGTGSTAITCGANIGHVQLLDLHLGPSTTGKGVDLSAGNSLSTYLREVRVGGGATSFDFDATGHTANNLIHATNCYAQGPTGIGFTTANVPACVLDSCSADTADTGYQLGGGVTLMSCTAESNTTRGFYVAGDGAFAFLNCYTNDQLDPFVVNAANAIVTWINPRTENTPSGTSMRITAIGEGVLMNVTLLDAGLDASVAAALTATLGTSVYST